MEFLKIKELNLIINKAEIQRVEYIQGEKQSELIYIGDRIIITFKNKVEHNIVCDKPNGLKNIMEKIYKQL